MNRIEEINLRISEIKELLNDENSNVEELRSEFESLKNEKSEIEKEIEERNNLKDEVLQSSNVIKKFKDEEVEKMEFRTIDEALQSRAYESAFAKTYLPDKQVFTEEEQRALDTTSGAALIPHAWLTEIYDQIKESHPILNDMTWQSINAIVEIPKRVAITAGDAAVVEEGNCAVDEENTFTSVQIDLVEIQKKITLTAKMGQLLPESFKNWLIAELRDRIGHQMAVQLVAKLKAAAAEDNKVEAASAGTLAVADLLNLFSLADGAGVPKVYVNRKTLYSNVYSLAGAQGQDAYVANLTNSMSGNLLGYEVKQESAMADGEMLVVFPQEVFFNVPGGIKTKQIEDECFKLTMSGLAFMGAALKYDKAAAFLTIGQAAG